MDALLPTITDRRGLELACYVALGVIMFLGENGHIDYVPHLMADTILIILAGTLGSVEVYNQKKKDPTSVNIEKISTSDAAKFPFFASLALFSLYLIFKFVPEEYVQPLVRLYFTVMGLFVLGMMLKKLMGLLIKDFSRKGRTILWFSFPSAMFMGMQWQGFWVYFSEPKDKKDITTVDSYDIFCTLLAIPLAYIYYRDNHWIMNNILGIGFCVEAIKWVQPGSWKIVTLLLGALFFYDIFWVFGTEVMVTVAKKLDGPIKLLFPKVDGSRPSLLGLGDIVLPAFGVSMMARFDAHLELRNNKSLISHQILSGSYFWVTLFAYFGGISLTLVAMLVFKAAQPALLYLSPCCTLIPMLFAFVRGEFSILWNYNEEDEEKKDR